MNGKIILADGTGSKSNITNQVLTELTNNVPNAQARDIGE